MKSLLISHIFAATIASADVFRVKVTSSADSRVTNTLTTTVTASSEETTNVCLVPYSADYVGIFDPVANSYTRGPSMAAEGADAFYGGVLTTSVYTRGPSIAAEGDAAFVGGVLLPSGMAEEGDNAFVGGVLTTSVYTRGPSMAAEGNNAFYGGVLLPSGKACLVPAEYVGIYDHPVAPIWQGLSGATQRRLRPSYKPLQLGRRVLWWRKVHYE